MDDLIARRARRGAPGARRPAEVLLAGGAGALREGARARPRLRHREADADAHRRRQGTARGAGQAARRRRPLAAHAPRGLPHRATPWRGPPTLPLRTPTRSSRTTCGGTRATPMRWRCKPTSAGTPGDGTTPSAPSRSCSRSTPTGSTRRTRWATCRWGSGASPRPRTASAPTASSPPTRPTRTTRSASCLS